MGDATIPVSEPPGLHDMSCTVHGCHAFLLGGVDPEASSPSRGVVHGLSVLDLRTLHWVWNGEFLRHIAPFTVMRRTPHLPHWQAPFLALARGRPGGILAAVGPHAPVEREQQHPPRGIRRALQREQTREVLRVRVPHVAHAGRGHVDLELQPPPRMQVARHRRVHLGAAGETDQVSMEIPHAAEVQPGERVGDEGAASLRELRDAAHRPGPLAAREPPAGEEEAAEREGRAGGEGASGGASQGASQRVVVGGMVPRSGGAGDVPQLERLPEGTVRNPLTTRGTALGVGSVRPRRGVCRRVQQREKNLKEESGLRPHDDRVAAPLRFAWRVA
jgi:hypothetical protein